MKEEMIEINFDKNIFYFSIKLTNILFIYSLILIYEFNIYFN